MSDWADEKAIEISAKYYGDWADDEYAGVAAALRAARNEALEEAAKQVMAEVGATRSEIAASIRALKDKQP